MTRAARQQGLWLGAALLASIACGYGVGAVSPSDDHLLIGALAVVLVLPIAVRVVTGQFDVFEPILYFALAWGGMFVARPIAMLVNQDFVASQAGYAEVSQTFDKMLLLALIGGVAFIVGYELPVGSELARRLRPLREFDTRAATSMALAVSAAGMRDLRRVLLPVRWDVDVRAPRPGTQP